MEPKFFCRVLCSTLKGRLSGCPQGRISKCLLKSDEGHGVRKDEWVCVALIVTNAHCSAKAGRKNICHYGPTVRACAHCRNLFQDYDLLRYIVILKEGRIVECPQGRQIKCSSTKRRIDRCPQGRGRGCLFQADEPPCVLYKRMMVRLSGTKKGLSQDEVFCVPLPKRAHHARLGSFKIFNLIENSEGVRRLKCIEARRVLHPLGGRKRRCPTGRQS